MLHRSQVWRMPLLFPDNGEKPTVTKAKKNNETHRKTFAPLLKPSVCRVGPSTS